MLKPHPLVPGDRVALVALASPFDQATYEAGVAEIRQLGLVPVPARDAFARRGYTAGSPATRARSLLEAWRDPDIAGIMAIRGGYGSAQVLPLLDPELLRAARKPFIGHSDLTALLIYLGRLCGLVSFHGPLVVNLGEEMPGYDRDSLLAAVSGETPMGVLSTKGVEVVRRGEATGPLLGGTLTQLVASLGTPYSFDPPKGYVLLLEDVGERPYRLDRMITQLAASGILTKAAAVVCGEFPGCDEECGTPTAREVIARLLESVDGPVLFGLATGHTRGPALTVPLGVEVRVSGGACAEVEVLEAAVEAR